MKDYPYCKIKKAGPREWTRLFSCDETTLTNRGNLHRIMSKNNQRIMRSPEKIFPKEILDRQKEDELPGEFIRRIAKEDGLTRKEFLKKYDIPNPLLYLFSDPGDDEIKSITEEGLKYIRSKFAPTEKINWKGPLYKLTEKCFKIHLERRKTEKTFLNQLFQEAADEWLYKDEEITVDQLQNIHDNAYNEGKYDI